jgi:hypothetical protein
MENFLVEKYLPKTIISPVDLNTAANTGLRVDMSKAKRVTFICVLAAGSTTTTHSIALKQHTVGSGGTPLALEVANPYFHKIGAATKFTKVAPTVAADTYDLHALLGDSASIVVFEVLCEQLAEGYRWVSLDIADAGGAQIGSVVALADCDFAPAYDQVA